MIKSFEFDSLLDTKEIKEINLILDEFRNPTMIKSLLAVLDEVISRKIVKELKFFPIAR